MNEITLDTIYQIAARGSAMTYYEMAEAMFKAINEVIVPSYADAGIKKYGGKDFFVHVETGHDPVFRFGMMVPKVEAETRLAMPLPNYEQQVYKYSNGELVNLWVIPDMNTCAMLRVEALNLMDQDRMSLDWVLKFYDGTYERMSNEYNQNLKV